MNDLDICLKEVVKDFENEYKVKLDKRDEYIVKLQNAVLKAARLNDETAKDYEKLALKKTTDLVDKADLLCRASGLREANVNIRNCFEEVMDMNLL